MARHKHADVIIAMANGEKSQTKDIDGNWFDPELRETNPLNYPNWQWRIKPRTIMIGDMEVPQPMVEPPDNGTKVYYPNCLVEELFGGCTYRGSVPQIRDLRRGMCHSTKEAAIAHAKALIAISGGTV